MAREKTVSVTVRLPVSVVGRVDAYAERRELTRTAAMLSLLRQALGSADDAPATAGDIKAVRLEVAAGMERIAKTLDGMALQAPAALPDAREAAEEERRRIRSLGPLDRLLGRF